jgi:hypothetical protein
MTRLRTRDCVSSCEPVQAEVAQGRSLVFMNTSLGPAPDHGLAAVGGGADAGRPVDVEADVALLGEIRLAGVDADPHR